MPQHDNDSSYGSEDGEPINLSPQAVQKLIRAFIRMKPHYEYLLSTDTALRASDQVLKVSKAVLAKELAELVKTQPMIPAYSLFGAVFLVVSAVLQVLLVMSGGHYSANPSDWAYFLQASTDGIPGAPNPARWTYRSICSVSDTGRNVDCRKLTPALAFNPAHRTNFGTTDGVPAGLLHVSALVHMSKFAWVMYLLAVIAVFAALGNVLVSNFVFKYTVCLTRSRKAKWALYLCFMALAFQTLAACLMT
jgi:hypothetical protein